MRVRRVLVAAASLSLVLAASCGGGDDDKGGDQAASDRSTTTTADDGASSTTTTAAGSTTAPGPGSTVQPTGSAEPGGFGWTADASVYREFVGKQFEFGCPPGGTPDAVYGTDVYTDDSSVCGAAVHAGRITAAEGGQVVVVVQPGQPSYKASSAHGVDAAAFGEYSGSFQVVDDRPFAGTDDPQPGGYGWRVTSGRQKEFVGKHFRYRCPAGGTPGTIYGTGTYTDDSPVCGAAVHAGKLTAATGGSVVIEIEGAHDRYEGSTANGVTSNGYAAWPGSFSFVD